MRRQLKLKPTTAKLQQRGSLPHLQLLPPLGFLPPKMQQPNKPLDSRSCHTHPQPACLLPRTGSKNTNTKVAWLLLLLLLLVPAAAAVVVAAAAAVVVAVAASASAALAATGQQQQLQVDLQAASQSRSQFSVLSFSVSAFSTALPAARCLLSAACWVGGRFLPACLPAPTDVACRHCCNQNGVGKLQARLALQCWRRER